MNQQTIYSRYSMPLIEVTAVMKASCPPWVRGWATLLLLLTLLFEIGIFASQWLSPLLFSQRAIETPYGLDLPSQTQPSNTVMVK